VLLVCAADVCTYSCKQTIMCRRQLVECCSSWPVVAGMCSRVAHTLHVTSCSFNCTALCCSTCVLLDYWWAELQPVSATPQQVGQKGCRLQH
jgi:hypothetical protein